MPREIKRIENQRKIDERVLDPLDLKLWVTCMIRLPDSSMFFSSPLSTFQAARTHSRHRPHRNQSNNLKKDHTNPSFGWVLHTIWRIFPLLLRLHV